MDPGRSVPLYLAWDVAEMLVMSGRVPPLDRWSDEARQRRNAASLLAL